MRPHPPSVASNIEAPACAAGCGRRAFLGSLPLLAAAAARAADAPAGSADAAILARIEANRPSRLARLPADFRERFGSAHVNGRYRLTDQPFLIEGARRLLDLGTRLGKFWFEADHPARSYAFNSRWGVYRTLTELAQSDYVRQVFELPFSTIVLEASSKVEDGWMRKNPPPGLHDAIAQEYRELAAHLYRTYRDRPVTFVLQNWEGDWLLRGSDPKFNPPPADWRERCDRMRRWFAARQKGVELARAEHAAGAKCVVAHAAEVNRVADAWKGIPTVTRDVLSGVEVDLVSYSAYDGIRRDGDPLLFWRCIEEIRAHTRTGPLYGPGAVAIGEFGIPENVDRERIAERYDRMLGVMLAAKVRYAAHWQLYCNELVAGAKVSGREPVRDPAQVRGFWLVRPDGSLSEGGRWFSDLWKRAAAEAGAGESKA